MSEPHKLQTCPSCKTPVGTSSAHYCRVCGAPLVGTPVPAPAPPIPDPVDPMVGRLVLGKYTITSIIGHGGMGTVFLARQMIGDTTRNVAIKVLAGQYARDPALVQRFKREAATIGSLSSPNTVRLLDFDTQDGQFFIVMEYVQGERLAEILDRGPLSPALALSVLLQVGNSLSEAHRNGIVHRDLKPENIMVRKIGDGTAIVTVLDFGVARHIDTDKDLGLTAHGVLIGTPAYMSPEQILGMSLGPQSDVYAMGLIAWHMLTGKHPFQARSVGEWARKHSAEPLPDLRKLVPGLPSRIYHAIEHSLAKGIEERTQSVAEFIRELTGMGPNTDVFATALSRMARSERPHSMERTTLTAPGTSRVPTMEPTIVPGLEPRSTRTRWLIVLGVVSVVCLGAFLLVRVFSSDSSSVAHSVDAARDVERSEAATTLTLVDVLDVSTVHDTGHAADVPREDAPRATGWIGLAHSALDIDDVHRAADALLALNAMPLTPREMLINESLRKEFVALCVRSLRAALKQDDCAMARSIVDDAARVSLDGSLRRTYSRKCH